jgi:hypothetical protein
MQKELQAIKSEIDEAFAFKQKIKEEKLKFQEKQDRSYALEIVKNVPKLIKKAAESNHDVVIVSQLLSENEAKTGANKFVLEMLNELGLNPTVEDLHYRDGFAICFKI